MTFKLSMKHCLCKYYQDCSNYDPGLTLTHFTPRSNLVTQAFVWEKVKIIYFLKTITVVIGALRAKDTKLKMAEQYFAYVFSAVRH